MKLNEFFHLQNEHLWQSRFRRDLVLLSVSAIIMAALEKHMLTFLFNEHTYQFET